MLKTEYTTRVRYGETDQMGVVYHAEYLRYLEAARTEMIRECGISYSQIEARGILMPVTDLEIQYHIPGRYDELLTLFSEIREKPDKRLHIYTTIHNQQGHKLVTCHVALAFVDKSRMFPVRCPQFIIDHVMNHMETKNKSGEKI